MKQINLSFTPSDVNLSGFADDVTGVTWTLTATSVPDGLAHQVTIENDTATNHSGKTVLLTGTDQDGHPLTETHALPGGNLTITSVNYFKTLTSAVPSATIGADTMDIGWGAGISSKTIPLNHFARNGIGFNVIVGGTINYTIQETNSEVEPLLVSDLSINWLNSGDSGVVSATTSKSSNFVEIPVAMRMIVNSYSSGATLILDINESGTP